MGCLRLFAAYLGIWCSSTLKTVDKSLRLGLKVTNGEKSIFFVIILWNLVNMTTSWVDNNDQYKDSAKIVDFLCIINFILVCKFSSTVSNYSTFKTTNFRISTLFGRLLVVVKQLTKTLSFFYRFSLFLCKKHEANSPYFFKFI